MINKNNRSMGYMNHMQHLVKCVIHLIQLGIKLVATEKYHGTSTNILQKQGTQLKFYSGGEKLDVFEGLFDKDSIQEKFDSLMQKNSWKSIKLHGETYGGPRLFPKQMANTYGRDKPKFIVFDIKIDSDTPTSRFLDFYETKEIAESLGLEFVHYVECPHEITMNNKDKIIEWFEEQTKLPSTCINNIQGNPREGIVIRPIIESIIGKKQERAICKNINENFKETKSFDQLKKRDAKDIKDKVKEFSEYDDFAEMWVTKNRGIHVLDEIRANRDNKVITIKDINAFLEKIIEDIKVESESDENFVWPNDEKEEAKLCRVIRKEAAFIFRPLCEEFNYEPTETV